MSISRSYFDSQSVIIHTSAVPFSVHCSGARSHGSSIASTKLVEMPVAERTSLRTWVLYTGHEYLNAAGASVDHIAGDALRKPSAWAALATVASSVDFRCVEGATSRWR